jgi:hypothetical protein
MRNGLATSRKQGKMPRKYNYKYSIPTLGTYCGTRHLDKSILLVLVLIPPKSRKGKSLEQLNNTVLCTNLVSVLARSSFVLHSTLRTPVATRPLLFSSL